jgi:hypothetical protein
MRGDGGNEMEQHNEIESDVHLGKGPKFHVNVEGVMHDWPSPTITTEQVAGLGGFDPALGVLEIDLTTNEERQLRPGETVDLKPGIGFSKKRRFRRG